MNIDKQKYISKLFNKLKNNLNTKTKTKLLFKKLNDDYANCIFDKQKKLITISISKELSTLAMTEMLIHEYAHALMFDNYPEICEDHCSEWGVYYAQVYREYAKIENIT